jgi:hypothetical protein
MEVLYFMGGFIVGSGAAYGWFLVGRNTGYQDKNIVPPPAPLKLAESKTQKDPGPPAGWVDDFHDPSMAKYRPEEEL